MNEIITITDGYTLNPGDLDWSGFSSFGEVRYYDRTLASHVASRCHDATIIVTNKTPVTAETISASASLKIIAVTATGFNVIDVEAAKRRNILVCNVPGYGTDSVAQHTFALILELANHVGKNSAGVSAGDWSKSKDFCYTTSPITELAEKTLGIIGYGQIGQKVAGIGRAFGMNILYSRSTLSQDPDAQHIAKVFSESDVVSLHCPLTKDNGGFVNDRLLRTMKKNALLINTARGQLVNEEDLSKALKEGVIAGAGLDVLSTEPPPSNNPLVGLSNCVITPHNAWYSIEARRRIMEMTVQNIKMALNGKPQNIVSR